MSGEAIELARLADLEEIRVLLMRFSATLVAVALGPKDGIPEWAASGTFVKVKEHPCILTAQHVWNRLKDYPELALVVRVGRHRYRIAMEEITGVVIAASVEEPWGPDLAALVLPELRGREIERRNRLFYNLDLHRGDIDLEVFRAAAPAVIETTTPISPLLLWGLAGTPAERSRFGQRISVANGIVGLSAVVQSSIRNGFHYLDLSVVYGPGTTAPLSFEGMSGSGLWLLPYMRRDDGSLRWSGKRILAGVAFYQSDVVNGNRFVRCHGPIDLNGVVYETLAAKVDAIKGPSNPGSGGTDR